MNYNLMDPQKFYELISWYKEQVKKTCAPLEFEDHVLHMQSGIITEFAELVDIYKKNFAYGKEIDRVNQSEEWADTMWYFCNLLTDKHDISKIMDFVKVPIMENNSRNILFYLVTDMNNYTNKFINRDISLEYMLGKWLSLAYFLNIDFEQALKNNIEKLIEKRYKNQGFSSENAINRNVEEEHKSLSKLKSKKVKK